MNQTPPPPASPARNTGARWPGLRTPADVCGWAKWLPRLCGLSSSNRKARTPPPLAGGLAQGARESTHSTGWMGSVQAATEQMLAIMEVKVLSPLCWLLRPSQEVLPSLGTAISKGPVMFPGGLPPWISRSAAITEVRSPVGGPGA